MTDNTFVIGLVSGIVATLIINLIRQVWIYDRSVKAKIQDFSTQATKAHSLEQLNAVRDLFEKFCKDHYLDTDVTQVLEMRAYLLGRIQGHS